MNKFLNYHHFSQNKYNESSCDLKKDDNNNNDSNVYKIIYIKKKN